MEPIIIGNSLVEVKIEDMSLVLVDKLDKLEDKYYMVRKGDNVGIYHKDFGLMM